MKGLLFTSCSHGYGPCFDILRRSESRRAGLMKKFLLNSSPNGRIAFIVGHQIAILNFCRYCWISSNKSVLNSKFSYVFRSMCHIFSFTLLGDACNNEAAHYWLLSGYYYLTYSSPQLCEIDINTSMPFYSWVHQGSERQSNLLKVTQLKSGRPWVQTYTLASKPVFLTSFSYWK